MSDRDWFPLTLALTLAIFALVSMGAFVLCSQGVAVEGVCEFKCRP